MIELAGEATAGLTETGRLTQDASTGAANPPLGGLVFDDTMDGLTLDDVSVVLVADRPVLVPLARELAERSGFTVVEVSDESLLSLGLAPRRPSAETAPQPMQRPTEPLADDARAPLTEPDPLISGTNTIAAADQLDPTDASEETVGTWATWPTPEGPRAVGHIETTLRDAADTSAPVVAATVTDRPVPSVQTRTEAPVETARPINSMAASHLDWEPEALGWPYIDRRLDHPPRPESAPLASSSTPRSLSSGRPVNGVLPTELVMHGDQSDADDVIIELRGAATASLAPLSMDIDAVSVTVLSGPRGSGKTSMLRLLAGFDAPTQGAGVVGGEQLLAIPLDDRAAREAISAGFIPQLPFLVPDLTVAENVELPLLASDVSPAMARGVAEETLRMVGLGAVMGLPSSVLSGSEIRLGAVARALVSSPEIVFADEPFAGLSDDDAATVLSCLHDVVADGGTVIIVCTDPRVRLHGVRQLVLDAGVIVRDEVVSTIG